MTLRKWPKYQDWLLRFLLRRLLLWYPVRRSAVGRSRRVPRTRFKGLGGSGQRQVTKGFRNRSMRWTVRYRDAASRAEPGVQALALLSVSWDMASGLDGQAECTRRGGTYTREGIALMSVSVIWGGTYRCCTQ